MKFKIQIQRCRVDFAEIEVDAESRVAAIAIANGSAEDALQWDGVETEIEPIWVEDLGRPKCPNCNCSSFNETQLANESQSVSWDEDKQRLVYGKASLNEIESVIGIECASCGKDLGADFFQPWHQGKTRSEIYGEHETTNNTKGEDQHD